MAVRTKILELHPSNRPLLTAVCLGQAGLIVLSFLRYGETGPLLMVLVLFSVVALVGSVTLAVFYLCLISTVIPTQFFDDRLLLPLDFKFYEGLFMVVCGVAVLWWLQGRWLLWERPTRFDRPVLVFLGLLVASMGLGLYYGQSVSQMLRDVRFPLYYVLFFVVTGFFDLRKGRTFLSLVVVCAVVVGVEYLAEFLEVVNLSISGSFYRVARTEGLMLPISILVCAAGLLYDPSPVRRTLFSLALIPIGLAFVLTMGRGMWIAFFAGLILMSGLVILDRQAGGRRGRRILILILLPLLVVGMGYLFQRATGTGVGEMALKRVRRVVYYQEDTTILGRFLSYGIALEKIRQRPLLGGGHGATVTYPITDQGEPFMQTVGKVDNLYLTLLLRMGVVGLAAFLWIFIRGLRTAYGLFQRTGDVWVKQFCAGFFAVYGAMLVYGMADATLIGNRLIFFHATFLGILARLDREAGDGA